MDPSSLKKFDLFKDVDESQLGKIAPFTMLVEFPEGKTIIQEGGFSNDFYAIESSSGSKACSRNRSGRPRSSRPRRCAP